LPGVNAEGFKKVDLFKLYDTSLIEEIKQMCLEYHKAHEPTITLNQLYAGVIARLQQK